MFKEQKGKKKRKRSKQRLEAPHGEKGPGQWVLPATSLFQFYSAGNGKPLGGL
jgi:hypothetical protein